jgi:signal transduction histidine kinase
VTNFAQDRKKLEQIMMILMSNAIKFSTKGGALLLDMEFVPSKKTKDIQQLE